MENFFISLKSLTPIFFCSFSLSLSLSRAKKGKAKGTFKTETTHTQEYPPSRASRRFVKNMSNIFVSSFCQIFQPDYIRTGYISV